MISPWAGVEHLDCSDSQWRQRVFVSCWGMCRGFHCVYAGRWLRQERREWEGCDGSENSPGGLGLPVPLPTRAAVRSGGGSEVEKIGRMAERTVVICREIVPPCHTLPPWKSPSAKGREWLSKSWGLRGTHALAPPPLLPIIPSGMEKTPVFQRDAPHVSACRPGPAAGLSCPPVPLRADPGPPWGILASG